jgi:hypothetical protein
MDDREYQIQNLQRIIGGALLSPVFRDNPKHKTDGVARIAYNDVMSCKYIIRSDNNFPKSGGYWSGKDGAIIAQYDSIEDLVDDGWRLD